MSIPELHVTIINRGGVITSRRQNPSGGYNLTVRMPDGDEYTYPAVTAVAVAYFEVFIALRDGNPIIINLPVGRNSGGGGRSSAPLPDGV